MGEELGPYSWEENGDEMSREERQRFAEEAIPTHVATLAYLRSLRVGVWPGRAFHIPTREDDAAGFLARAVDATNAIRNLAIDQDLDINEAARRYHQLQEKTWTETRRKQ